MAENEELAIDEGRKKSLNKLIIPLVAILLGISIGATAVFFVLGSRDEDVAEQAEPEMLRSQYQRLEKSFIVTLISEGKPRYLQVNVAIKSKQQPALDTLATHAPVIKSQLSELFASQQLQFMQTTEGRESLNAQATALVQDFLAEKAPELVIEQVLFTDFVMQ